MLFKNDAENVGDVSNRAKSKSKLPPKPITNVMIESKSSKGAKVSQGGPKPCKRPVSTRIRGVCMFNLPAVTVSK